MRADFARLDLSNRRRALLAYAAGMSLYTVVVVALYPAFKNSASLNDFVRSDATAAALFGVTGDLTSSGGWLNGNLYANFFPLVMLLLTVGYGAAAIAGQDEDGTLCLLAVLPTPRRQMVLQKAAALALQAAVLAGAVELCVALGRSFQLTAGIGDTVLTSGTVGLLGIDFGLLALAVGARTGRRGLATGTVAALAATSYLLSSLAPVVSWLRPIRYASLFYWAVGHDQIRRGVGAGDWLVLAAVGAVALGAAVTQFDRLDIRSG